MEVVTSDGDVDIEVSDNVLLQPVPEIFAKFGR
jgi:hypothetical protein